jgi:hypothetical protein
VLLERIEPEQFAPGWETGRYSVYNDQVWDWKGPCPTERYIELRAHCAHDGECCPCRGDTCECGEDYDHCWGKYLDPNDRLLDWIRKVVAESVVDSDVKPTQDARFFIAPNAQRQVLTAQLVKAEKQKEDIDEWGRQLAEFWRRKPVSTNLRRTESGLYLLN